METKTTTEYEKRNVDASTIRSMLLLFFILFTLVFIDTLVHEGAHLISNLSHGLTIQLFFAHPFTMNGFVSIVGPGSSTVWDFAAGHIATVLISLPLFILLWRRRSVSILPLVMWFPYTASTALSWVIGLALGMDDFNHIIDMTGWPAWPFFIIFSILAVVGIVLFVSCFPLLGLKLKDKRTLFVIPAASLLYALVGLIVAYLFVPGSPADVQFHLGEWLISAATNGLLLFLYWSVLFIPVYFTLYPIIERKFPAYLRTERRNLVWRDLLIPGILCTISIVVGILIIR